MTLLEKLQKKRKKALKQTPKNALDLLCEVIKEELESFTGRELSLGSRIFLEVDIEENQYWITSFVSGGDMEEKFTRQNVIEIDVEEKEILMELVMRRFGEEGIIAWKIEEGMYAFEARLAEGGKK